MSDADVSTTNRGDLTPTIMDLFVILERFDRITLGSEPVFPSNYDVVHGQYLHRTDMLISTCSVSVVDLTPDTSRNAYSGNLLGASSGLQLT